MSHVAFQVHEHEGHLVYTEHGRSSYDAWSRVLNQGFDWYCDGLEVTAGGITWTVEADFNPNTGLKPRADDVADERMNEYWITATGVGENDRRKASFKLSPRWRGQETIHDEELQTPFQHERVEIDGEYVDMPQEGVDVEYRTSNLADPQAPERLLPAIIHALADEAGEYFDYDYFQTPHPISNVKSIEGYVRHERDRQDQLVESDGVLMRTMHLLGSRVGSDVRYHANNEEVVGHMHRVRVADDTIADLCPGQQFGKQFKSYLPKHDIDHGPLAHPKFGVLVKSAWQSETLYYRDLVDIWQEIEEAGVNVLSWSGMQTGVHGPWVEDDHFSVEASTVDVDRFEDPLPMIEASQDAHVIKLFTEASEADMDLVDELAADGGEAHHAVLEEASGYSSSTVYRALQRIPELLESDNGLIQFTSEKLYQDVRDIFHRTEEHIERAADRLGKILDVDADMLADADNAIRRFVQEFAADFEVNTNYKDNEWLEVKLNSAVSTFKSTEASPKIWVVIKKLKKALRVSDEHNFEPSQVLISYRTPEGYHHKHSLTASQAAPH